MHKQQRKLASRITQQPLRGQSEKAHLHRTANSFLFGTKIKIYSPQTLAEQEQAPHVGRPARLRDKTRLSGMCTAQFRARATGLTIRSSRARFAVSARLETSGQRAGLTQALGVEMPFRSRTRRKHLRARACSSVSDLVSCDCGIRSSPSGLSLRLVPAGRIARSCVHPHRPRPILLRQAGKALRFRPCGNQVLSGNLAPNNSFKPSPLRGLVAVSLAGRGPA